MTVTRAALLGWLTGLWLVLWRDYTAANAVAGLAVAIVMTSLFPGTQGQRPTHRVRLHWVVAFLLYFHWKLLEANLVVAREILRPRDHIRAGIIAVSVEGSSDLVITIIANAITLTPGTLTLDVDRDPAVLYVHVLHLHDVEEARRDVHRLHDLAVRAMGADTGPRRDANDRERAHR